MQEETINYAPPLYVPVQSQQIPEITEGNPEEQMKIRFVCISDTHGLHDSVFQNQKLPDGDILIHCGDYTDRAVDRLPSFCKFLENQKKLCGFKHIILVPGNHEPIIPELMSLPILNLVQKWALPENTHLLLDAIRTLEIPFKNEDDEIDEGKREFGRVVIYGSRYSPMFSFPSFGYKDKNAKVCFFLTILLTKNFFL